ncbi:hypothetical protein FOVSG1_002772 [Fusarium oxysporum f. sp. vasinfectum]
MARPKPRLDRLTVACSDQLPDYVTSSTRLLTVGSRDGLLISSIEAVISASGEPPVSPSRVVNFVFT